LTEYVRERSESFYEQLELLMEIQEEGPISTERLVEETKVKKEVAEERLERLEERGEIGREDDHWAVEE
jgi:DNA-binding Lrp family transcriptional regulator